MLGGYLGVGWCYVFGVKGDGFVGGCVLFWNCYFLGERNEFGCGDGNYDFFEWCLNWLLYWEFFDLLFVDLNFGFCGGFQNLKVFEVVGYDGYCFGEVVFVFGDLGICFVCQCVVEVMFGIDLVVESLFGKFDLGQCFWCCLGLVGGMEI